MSSVSLNVLLQNTVYEELSSPCSLANASPTSKTHFPSQCFQSSWINLYPFFFTHECSLLYPCNVTPCSQMLTCGCFVMLTFIQLSSNLSSPDRNSFFLFFPHTHYGHNFLLHMKTEMGSESKALPGGSEQSVPQLLA